MESSGTSFSAAFRAVAPFQEYLLQGSIMDAHCEVLLHRLRGLCDNADTTPETFNDYEAVYQLSKSQREMVILQLYFILVYTRGLFASDLVYTSRTCPGSNSRSGPKV